jgi:hypothetical protein
VCTVGEELIIEMFFLVETKNIKRSISTVFLGLDIEPAPSTSLHPVKELIFLFRGIEIVIYYGIFTDFSINSCLLKQG